MADFQTTFQSLDELLRSATAGFMSKIDQVTFRMLVDCLKNPDYQVVVDSLEQLERENRLISIPPVYFLAQAHPDPRIRRRATQVLAKLDPEDAVKNLVQDKETNEAIKALILHYGNFRK
ncbi:MAG: hypothetical protein K2W82_19095 [Candidatus Obscuribacterales bacterium]|nr:hypothetical protein [Candidatus Obscuribacterales bacterium]